MTRSPNKKVRSTAIADGAKDEWLTPEEMAEEWKVSPKTLANWRSARIGPPYSKFEGLVRYSREASTRWAAEREMQPEGVA